MKKKALPILVVCGLIVIIVAIMGVTSLIRKYTPSKERQDLNTYYNVSSNDQVAIILNNERIESQGKLIDGHVYLDYNFISIPVSIGITMKIYFCTQLRRI